MAAESFYFGHPIRSGNGDEWRYADNGGVVPERRPCPRCKQFEDDDGGDPCLGRLPGVKAACCGHGVEDGYISFVDGTTIRGRFSVERDQDVPDDDALADLIGTLDNILYGKQCHFRQGNGLWYSRECCEEITVRAVINQIACWAADLIERSAP